MTSQPEITAANPPAAKPASTKRLIRFLILSGIVGAGLTCAVTLMVLMDVFQRWQPVMQAPQGTQAVVYGDFWRVYIRLSDGRVFSSPASPQEESWIPDAILSNPAPEPCDPKGVAFSLISNAPKDMVSCVQVLTYRGEGRDNVIYAMDHAGLLWKWEQIGVGWGALLFPFIVLGGGLGAAILASAIWPIKEKVKSKRRSVGSPSFSKVQVLLLALPALCLISILGLWLIPLFLRTPNAANEDATYWTTAAAETVSAALTKTPVAEATEWAVAATPGLPDQGFSFTESCSQAQWGEYQSNQIECHEGSEMHTAAVRTVSDPSIKGVKIERGCDLAALHFRLWFDLRRVPDAGN